MTLTADEIAKVKKRLVREYTKTKPADMTTPEFNNAVTLAEAWVTSNEASFNTALPEPFKTNATTTEKALLLAYVLSVKYLGG